MSEILTSPVFRHLLYNKPGLEAGVIEVPPLVTPVGVTLILVPLEIKPPPRLDAGEI